jgi:hypothetical protein
MQCQGSVPIIADEFLLAYSTVWCKMRKVQTASPEDSY